MASKSYGWDVRNIAKISPKMVKKGPFFDFRKKDLSRLLYRTCGSGFSNRSRRTIPPVSHAIMAQNKSSSDHHPNVLISQLLYTLKKNGQVMLDFTSSIVAMFSRRFIENKMRLL